MNVFSFEGLMRRLASSWAEQDPDAAVSCFTADAVYMEPPNVQLFVGWDQLRSYFSPLQPGTYLDLHNLWFDSHRSVGAVEYSFGVKGHESADHGVAVVEVADDRISAWREYQRKGPAPFLDFIDTENKDWEWHIGNYP